MYDLPVHDIVFVKKREARNDGGKIELYRTRRKW